MFACGEIGYVKNSRVIGGRATTNQTERATHLRTLLLKHWVLDGRATEDGRPYNSADRRGD
ncbi:MAG: hypothetical protein FWG68_07610, partial [Defluviitaleaceae bacterium]|nr:hypothetical protein [Defluviitaleaceae bacterium]